jgi:selenocysteine lyase/cysteine desulfurase
VSERLLLTGHSHQAWPDCGFEGQKQAWTDAAQFVDDKWGKAFAQADRVRRGYARLLDDADGCVALSSNTHDLVIRFLSALPLRVRRRLITTDGEYHSIRRQLDRLAEEGFDIVKVSSRPAATVAERLRDAVDERTAAVLVSAVFYDTGHIAPNLGRVLEACLRAGVELLVDVYHALNVVPFSIKRERLDGAFIVGGGYKYCQLGEGNCFLRFPRDCELRPAVTGWFSEFTTLAASKRDGRVAYGQGSDRFAGATYDPTSHYRGAAVFDFFDEQGLTPEFLREVSQHQVGLMIDAFDRIEADPAVVTRDRDVALSGIGGFLSLRSPMAEALCQGLRARGVSTDHRGSILRMGPAPYLSDRQLTDAMGILGEVIRQLKT